MVGTFIFTLFIVGTEPPFYVFLGQWIITCFTMRISGAHLNPAISFAFSLRKDTGGLSRKLAVAYILAQIIGALLACLLSLWLFGPVQAI